MPWLKFDRCMLREKVSLVAGNNKHYLYVCNELKVSQHRKGKLSTSMERVEKLHYHSGSQPPATLTHSGVQLPGLPSTSSISVSQRQWHPTPLCFGVS